MAHLLSMIATVDLASLLAVQHFNDRSGVVVADLPEQLRDCDLYLTVELVNRIGTPEMGVSKLLERLPSNPTLANPRPIGIVGAGNSVTSKALAIIGGVNNLVQCSPSATSPGLDDRSTHPYFTRPTPTNLGSARAAVEYYKFLGVTHVASLHVGDVYGQEFAKVFIEQAEKAGIDVFSVSFDLDFEQHAGDAVRQLKNSGRRYIFGMFYEDNLGRISDLAAPAGIMGTNYFWMLGEASDDINLKPSDGDVKSRLKDVNGMGRVALYIPASERFNAALDSFRQDKQLQQYYISKTEINTTKLVEANFTNVVATDFELFNYDAAMAICLAACEADQEFFSASDLYESMIRTKFNGVTGQVEFDNTTGTRYLSNVRYKIFNSFSYPDPEDDAGIIFRSTESAIIDLTPSGGKVEIVTPFRYADNTTSQPIFLPLQLVNENLITSWALGIGLGFSGIMMVMSIALAVWTYVNRGQRVVRASQPCFLLLLCIGTFLVASSIVPTSFQEPMNDITLNIGCMLFPWLACLGFVTAFSALFTKNRRINKIYRSARACQRVTIKPRHVIKPFIVFFALNVTILTTWTVIAPWKWKRVAAVGVDEYGRSTETYGTCASDNDTLAKLFGSLLAIANAFPVFFSAYESFRGRNLPTEFNESRYLFATMTSLLETLLIGLPIILIAVKPTAIFLVRAGVLCLACLAILLPLFIPKWLRTSRPDPETRRLPMISKISSTAEEKRLTSVSHASETR
jgi:ABC-type branched-subunit amino acid transport system substrate-binding protein